MAAAKNVIDILKRNSFFEGLAEADLNRLASKLVLRTYPPETILCAEGSKCDSMYIIEEGEIGILKSRAGGAALEITVLKTGEIAGEMSLFGEMIRSATLKTKTQVKAWVLEYNSFNELLEASATLARALLAKLAKYLRRETSVVAKLLSQDVDRRLKIAFFDSKPYMKEAFTGNNKYDFSFLYYESRLTRETVSLAAGSNAVCVFVNDLVDAEVVDELASMGIKKIALRCAGFNNVDLGECEKLGVSVTRVPAYSPYAVAEHAVALMMALNRRIHKATVRVREGNFSLSGLVGFDVHGKTAGIIGAGKIGKCLLSILKGFGCRLLVFDPLAEKTMEAEFGCKLAGLDELLAESEIISLHAPLIPSTKHVINAESIAKMKRGVMLLNTSRGGLIDSKALLDGLKSGKIGYAGLDVYEEESAYFFEDVSDEIMSDDVLARLLTFNNVIITSHQAFLTKEALANIAETTIENLHEFQLGKRGKELSNFIGTTAQ
jgi:D-lactate dehydrogenase